MSEAVVGSAPDWLREVPLAHRGLHGDGIPENSLAAFEAAARAGYGVELDVRLSRDGQPVVVHDAGLARVAGVDERVDALTADQLAEVRLRGTDHGVPTLRAALRAAAGVPVMLELKQGRPRAGRLERAVAAMLDDHDGPCCVAGFNPATVRWFRRNRPRVIRVLTATSDAGVRLPRVLRRRLAELRDLPSIEPGAVSYALDGLPNPATSRWRELGGVLITWTVRDDDELDRATDLADNLIFEHVRPPLPPAGGDGGDRRAPR